MMAMCDVFGVKHKSLKMVSEPGYEHRFTPHPRTWDEYLDPTEFTGTGIFDGHTLPANLYVQCFETDGAEEILRYNGMTAGALNACGKGKSVILGSYIGHNATAYKNNGSNNFVKKLLNLASVEYADNNGVNIQERRADAKKAYIIFNATNEARTVALPIVGSYIDSYGGQISGNEIEIQTLDMAVVIVKE